MSRFAKYFACLCWSLLAGCATIPSAGIDDAKQLPPDGGVVAVQVVTNSAHLADAISNWTEVVVVQQGALGPDGKPVVITIPALIDGLSTTRVFVGVLKPGRYRFAGLSGFAKPGDFAAYLNASAPPTVGWFDVQTGRLTNLGTVLFQPFHPDPLATKFLDQNQKSSYAMSRLDDATSLAEFVAARYPEQFRLTQGNPTLGWVADSLGPQRTKLADAIRAYALPSLPHFVAETREIVYTARLGTLYTRHDDGSWTTCHAPTNHELLAYARLPDGRSVTGGERGGIWITDQVCAQWESAPLPEATQNVVWLGMGGGSDTLFALANEAGRYRIYASPRVGAWSWKLIKEYGKYDPPIYLNQALHAEGAPAVYLRDAVAVLSASSGVFELDMHSASVTSVPTDSLFRVVTQPDGIVVGSPRSAWMGVKPPRVSRDGGRNWEDYQRLGTFGAVPYVFSNGDALAMNSSASFVFVGWKKNATVEVVMSHDKGKTSEVVGQVPYGCDKLEGAISRDDLLFARCFDGSLLRSTDRGRNWVADFSRAVRSDALPPEFQASSGG